VVKTPLLSPESIAPLLTTRAFGRTLLCFDEVDSTNTVASERARAGTPEGTVVIAETQTRGRGRLGRAWVSPPHRNLYLSLVLRPDLPTEQLSCVSLVTGVAVCEAVGEWTPASLKWPNDVLVAGRKIAGILIEMEGEGAERFIVPGIGVNLNGERDDFPPELRDKAVSLRMASGATVDRARFAARLLYHLESRYEQLRALGFAPLAQRWEELSGCVGADVTIEERGRRVSGRVLGLAADGALRLRLPSGAEQRVVSGDVTVVGGYDEARDTR
jgi:BirA family biotin operon repressor/biotin-[acetyl-CoA-carboxylase] ligase